MKRVDGQLLAAFGTALALVLWPLAHPVQADHTGRLSLQSVQDHVDDLQAAVDALASPATCGNGSVDSGETCDGGTSATCEQLGFVGGTLGCYASCSLDTSACDPITCGDAILSPGEACDGAPELSCLELGFAGGSVSCDASCAHDTSACDPLSCGDGILSPGEACDTVAALTCADLGFAGGAVTCDPATCTHDTSACWTSVVCGPLSPTLFTLGGEVSEIRLIDNNNGNDLNLSPVQQATLMDLDSISCLSYNFPDVSEASFFIELSAPNPNDFFRLCRGHFISSAGLRPDNMGVVTTDPSGLEQQLPSSTVGIQVWRIDGIDASCDSFVEVSGSAPLRLDIDPTDDWDICEIQLHGQLCEPQ